VILNLNEPTHALLPLLSEAGTTNRRRTEAIWRSIQDTMSELSTQFQEVKRYQDMNKAIARELFAVSRELAHHKLLLYVLWHILPLFDATSWFLTLMLPLMLFTEPRLRSS
jgi:type I site-specific restriction endonuclease